jgi:hypothetical protein
MARGSDSTDAAEEDDPGSTHQIAPTVSIYQNSEHVSGILQQLFGEPLVTEQSRESLDERKDSSGTTTNTGGAAQVAVKAPIVQGSVKGDRTRGSREDQDLTLSTRSVTNFVYSQAYYLYLVRDTLRARGHLKTVASSDDALGLSSGDFIEYQATFRPNEINALLDILTPDLIAAITAYRVRSQGARLLEGFEDIEDLKSEWFKAETKASVQADLARAVATALRVDFRSESTREYYGTIDTDGDHEVTAVTICDNTHFVVEDEDRILDGHFTVLGKVTSPADTDVPVLERNKVLERLQPTAVDQIFEALRQSVEPQAQRLSERSSAAGGDFPSGSDLLNVEFASRVPGLSFRVIPIAIYA